MDKKDLAHCTYSFHCYFDPVHLHDRLPDGLGRIRVSLLGDEFPHGLLQLLEEKSIPRQLQGGLETRENPTEPQPDIHYWILYERRT